MVFIIIPMINKCGNDGYNMYDDNYIEEEDWKNNNIE